MSTISVKFKGDPVAFVRRKVAFGEKPFRDLGPKFLKRSQTSMLEELRAGEFRRQSGQVVKWRKPLDVPGRRPGPTLGGTAGRYGDAVRGAKVRATDRELTVTMTGGPWLGAALGGQGGARSLVSGVNKPKTATPAAMAAAVSLSMGVHISAEKAEKGFEVVRRPYGEAGPRLRASFAEDVAEAAANA